MAELRLVVLLLVVNSGEMAGTFGSGAAATAALFVAAAGAGGYVLVPKREVRLVSALGAAKAHHLHGQPFVASLLEHARHCQAEYLAHEYMCEAWRPCFHSDVVDALSPAKLDWVASANLLENFSPLMLTEEAVNGMRPGAIIVDLAAPTGGNCALTRAGEEVHHKGVIILGPLNVPATVPGHASQLYSRNLVSFLTLINDKGNLKIDMADEILKGSCVTYQGGSVHPKVAAALGQPVASA